MLDQMHNLLQIYRHLTSIDFVPNHLQGGEGVPVIQAPDVRVVAADDSEKGGDEGVGPSSTIEGTRRKCIVVLSY